MGLFIFLLIMLAAAWGLADWQLNARIDPPPPPSPPPRVAPAPAQPPLQTPATESPAPGEGHQSAGADSPSVAEAPPADSQAR